MNGSTRLGTHGAGQTIASLQDAATSSQTNDLAAAEERFLNATRAELQRLLRERNIRPVDLARRLRISKARVSYLLSKQGTNLTLRFIARIYDALDEEPVLTSASYVAAVQIHAKSTSRIAL